MEYVNCHIRQSRIIPSRKITKAAIKKVVIEIIVYFEELFTLNIWTNRKILLVKFEQTAGKITYYMWDENFIVFISEWNKNNVVDKIVSVAKKLGL